MDCGHATARTQDERCSASANRRLIIFSSPSRSTVACRFSSVVLRSTKLSGAVTLTLELAGAFPSASAFRAPLTVYPRSEEHTSELQSLMRISYAVFCLKKKTTSHHNRPTRNSYV